MLVLGTLVAIRKALPRGKRNLHRLARRSGKRMESWTGAALALLLLALATTPAHPGHDRDELSLLTAAQTHSERALVSALLEAGDVSEVRISASGPHYDALDSGAAAIAAAHRTSP